MEDETAPSRRDDPCGREARLSHQWLVFSGPALLRAKLLALRGDAKALPGDLLLISAQRSKPLRDLRALTGQRWL